MAQAIAVASIKTLVPVTLDLVVANYSQWRGLFEVALCKYALDDHITKVATTSTDVQWKHLDALIKSWMYGSISTEILAMVMSPNTTAHIVWTSIQGLYEKEVAR